MANGGTAGGRWQATGREAEAVSILAGRDEPDWGGVRDENLWKVDQPRKPMCLLRAPSEIWEGNYPLYGRVGLWRDAE